MLWSADLTSFSWTCAKEVGKGTNKLYFTYESPLWGACHPTTCYLVVKLSLASRPCLCHTSAAWALDLLQIHVFLCICKLEALDIGGAWVGTTLHSSFSKYPKELGPLSSRTPSDTKFCPSRPQQSSFTSIRPYPKQKNLLLCFSASSSYQAHPHTDQLLTTNGAPMLIVPLPS